MFNTYIEDKAMIPIAVYDSKHLASLEWHRDYVLVG